MIPVCFPPKIIKNTVNKINKILSKQTLAFVMVLHSGDGPAHNLGELLSCDTGKLFNAGQIHKLDNVY